MPHRMLTLEQAARHIHIDPHELLHLAQREEIPFRKRGEEYFFEHRVVDDWAQRHLLELPPKNLVRQHKEVIIDSKRTVQDDKLIAALMKPEWIDPAMASRTRPGVIRDMVALAQETGLLYDDVIFQQEVEEREKAASTAIGEGAAFLHARYHDPYYAAGSFVILGRTIQPIYFGAKDGLTTDLFFLLCCVDDVLHIHTLARLCLLIHRTKLSDQLREAESAEAMCQCMIDAEEDLLSKM